MLVIGFLGKKRCGKDTSVRICTDYLTQKGFHVHVIRFAHQLKKLLSSMTGQPYSFFDDDETKEKAVSYDVAVAINENIKSFHALDWPKTLELHSLGEQNPVQRVDDALDLFRQLYSTRLQRGEIICPRWMLQTLGTDCLREKVDNYIWTKLVELKLAKIPAGYNQIVLVSDVRFWNEISTLEKWNAWFVRLIRPNLVNTNFTGDGYTLKS